MLSQLSDTQPTQRLSFIYIILDLKRQTLKIALGKFNISIVSTDSNTITQKANKVYTDFTVETGGLTHIQKLFMSNLINALETQITKRVEKAHIPVMSRL